MEKRLSLRRYLLTVFILGGLLLAACSTPQSTPIANDSPAEVVVEHGESNEEAEHSEGAVKESEHTEGEEHEDEYAKDEEHEDEHSEGEEHEDEGIDLEEHNHAEIPHDFEGLENPFGEDPEAIAAGAELFAMTCAVCHGEGGEGDGPSAAGLDPKPASLADADMMADLSDAYLFWRITEGGMMEPFNSSMPPWGESLSEEQRWQLVSYIRTLSE
ncbi:MAG: c-type cytochrome [Anaerolineales bacterium]|nr:c-type cytochrome [Anaerolineales bacterium]